MEGRARDPKQRALGIDLDAYDRKTVTFARIEAGLIRLRRRRRGA